MSCFSKTRNTIANSGYQYQYNGKEWQDELGYDDGARIYDQLRLRLLPPTEIINTLLPATLSPVPYSFHAAAGI
jgi:hypothetical protein